MTSFYRIGSIILVVLLLVASAFSWSRCSYTQRDELRVCPLLGTADTASVGMAGDAIMI